MSLIAIAPLSTNTPLASGNLTILGPECTVVNQVVVGSGFAANVALNGGTRVLGTISLLDAPTGVVTQYTTFVPQPVDPSVALVYVVVPSGTTFTLVPGMLTSPPPGGNVPGAPVPGAALPTICDCCRGRRRRGPGCDRC